MAWIYLLIAGLLEIVWATSMKFTDGFTRFWPTVWTLTAMAASVFFLSRSLRELPLGTAYAVWTGIGAVGAVVIGIVLFREPRDWVRLLCAALILAGIAGLKLRTPAPSEPGPPGQEGRAREG